MKHSFENQQSKKITSPEWLSKRKSLHAKNISIDFLNPKNKFEGFFWKTTWPLLVLGQIFGLMPVCGVSTGSILDLKFKWTSKRTVYSLIVAASLSLHVLMLFEGAVRQNNGIMKMSSFLLVLFVFGFFFSFFALALKWPEIVNFWTCVERQLPSFPCMLLKRRFILNTRIVAFGILFVASIEHSLAIGAELYFLIACKKEEYPLLLLDRGEGPYLYDQDGVVIWIPGAIYIRIIAFMSSFIVCYKDVFLVTIGMTLTAQFKLFNDDLKRIQEQEILQDFWIHRRNQYNKLSNLVKKIDNAVTHLIFLSFANNLFFICSYLFISLKPLPTAFGVTYFWFSMLFNIMRVSVLGFSLMGVNDESKQTVDILHEVPSHLWNAEAERFCNVATNRVIALSGLRFFYVTRKIALTIVGMIVTYEIVLLQFSLSGNEDAQCS